MGPESTGIWISLPTWSLFDSAQSCPDVVRHIIAGVIHPAASTNVLRDLPVSHLVPFAIAVAPDVIKELHPIIRRQEVRCPSLFAGYHSLCLDAVIWRDYAAVGNIEPHTVHTKFIVDEYAVRVFRVVDYGRGEFPDCSVMMKNMRETAKHRSCCGPKTADTGSDRRGK